MAQVNLEIVLLIVPQYRRQHDMPLLVQKNQGQQRASHRGKENRCDNRLYVPMHGDFSHCDMR